MEVVFTPSELLWTILFLILVGVGIYAIIALKKLGSLARETRMALRTRQAEINRMIPEFKQVSMDALESTGNLRQQTGAAREMAEVIGFGSEKNTGTMGPSRSTLVAMVIGKAAGMLAEAYVNKLKKKR